MSMRIHRPKLLVAVLLVVLGVGSSAVIWVEGQAKWGSDSSVYPSVPVSEQVVPAEKRAAVEVIEDSGIVERINGNQTWSASEGYTNVVGGKTVVEIEVLWDTPVTSSGPWVDIECRGTRRIEGSREFTNVTKLAFYVDTVAGTVVGYAVGAHEPEESGAEASALSADTHIKVTDAADGSVVYDGRYADLGEYCADGFKDG